ncbi:MAG: hypothetical protein AB7N76_01135 [Planctomycetota bacterium]
MSSSSLEDPALQAEGLGAEALALLRGLVEPNGGPKLIGPEQRLALDLALQELFRLRAERGRLRRELAEERLLTRLKAQELAIRIYARL